MNDQPIKNFLVDIGCCDLCVLRYLGQTAPQLFRDQVEKSSKKNGQVGINEMEGSTENPDEGNGIKRFKRNPCVACLGLLQECIEDSYVDKIVDEIKQANIESHSFCPVLSCPVAIQIRACAIWKLGSQKFPQHFDSMRELEPEGTPMKSVWKWICSEMLRNKVDPKSDWSNLGTLSISISILYSEEEAECGILENYFRNVVCMKVKKGARLISRSSVQSLCSSLETEEFQKAFGNVLSAPKSTLIMGSISCSHAPVFLAGRYCKYSRKLSQTPWLIDGERKTESSVEELVSTQAVKLFLAESAKFSASGREDVDVRTLGRGRPFVIEIINPKKTIFTPERISSLQQQINGNTNLISICDLQVVNKSQLNGLKDGEESKTKTYCALCITPGVNVTQEILNTLNNYPLPIKLAQKTPVRVLHRRSAATRERSILGMNALPVASSSNMFKLYVTTEAGTYVKEFVHGDLGRTFPNVSSILGCDADIIALDVEEVNVDWPPAISS